MHIDWHLTQPVKALDYPDHLQPGRSIAMGGDGPACAACGIGRPCGARECPNNPPKVEVAQ